jgi:hypothetical protein
MFIHVWAEGNERYLSTTKLLASVNHVVINEVELNPPENDNYLTVEEWVELYNPTDTYVDISGWTLSTTHGTTETFTIPQGTVLASHSYSVFWSGSQWLDNDDESVVLRDNGSTEVDRTSTKSDNDNNSLSWQRYPNGEDNWSFRSSTKGTSNGADTEPPTILSVSQNPQVDSVAPEDEVTVNALVVDYGSGVNGVTLNYTKNDEGWFSIEMVKAFGNSWSTTISAFPENTIVTYVIIAEDKAGNRVIAEETGYMVSNGENTTPPDTTSPTITVTSPQNTTYATTTVPLIFTVDETTSWIGYSLDGQNNVTITGTVDLTGLSEEAHILVVYATDNVENTGVSSTIHFTVYVAPPEVTPSDTEPPTIVSVNQIPLEDFVNTEDEVTVNAIVSDYESGVNKVTLKYTTGNGDWLSLEMTNTTNLSWSATIPKFPENTNITYIIIARDNVGNTVTTEEIGYDYGYHVIPEFPNWLILPLFMIATLFVMFIKKLKQQKIPNHPMA